MKRYIAFQNSSNSGIQTREKALEWAANTITQKGCSTAYLCEVMEVIERSTPPITTRAYVPQSVLAEAAE